MRLPQVRFTMRRLMVVVAVVAVSLTVWAAWFDPVRGWQRAVTDDENGMGRWQALDEMMSGNGRVDEATALATLTDALRSPSYCIRETAIAGLGRLGAAARPAASALIEALADPDVLVRASAAAELISVLPPGDTGRGEAVPPLIRLLGDRSRQVRVQAAVTLTEFGHGGDAVPVLIEVLRGTDYLAQCDALWAFGCIGPPAARDAMSEVKALESRAETAVAPDLARYLRVYAARARCLLGDRTGGLAALRALSDGPEADLAREARLVLSRLPDEVRDEPTSDDHT